VRIRCAGGLLCDYEECAQTAGQGSCQIVNAVCQRFEATTEQENGIEFPSIIPRDRINQQISRERPYERDETNREHGWAHDNQPDDLDRHPGPGVAPCPAVGEKSTKDSAHQRRKRGNKCDD